MKIKERVYRQIISQYSPAPPERGSIIGMKDGVICQCIHDKVHMEAQRAVYVPDTEFLNDCIQKWALSGVEFCGFVHSHPHGQKTLSGADCEYIEKLYQCNPWLNKTFFPLIVDGNDMIVYSARMNHGCLEITREEADLID